MPFSSITGISAVAASLPLLAWLWGMIREKTREGEAAIISTGSIAASLLLSLWVLAQTLDGEVFRTSGTWIDIGTESSGLRLTWGLRVDGLAAAMLAMVSGVATLVYLFSTAYMSGDHAFSRYFAHMGFFCSAMMWLVLADNLLLLFVCWELVGLASYLLIGFWREKEAPANASQKAFIVNRLGDAGFLIGIMILISFANTLNLEALPEAILTMDPAWQMAAAFGFFLGAAGKSAQFPLQGWLPDAMEGPTPVSSLIHAATMVAAGVYLLARIAFLIPPEAGAVIAFVGALTAMMAALSAMTQWNIKRVLAFSTISQLGYMVMGIGVGARDIALLHLFTHAFFKCALFLSAGAVIHAVHSQDMREMGGLRRQLPRVFFAYLPPMLALAGLPLFSGFLSKDGILLGATNWAMELGGMTWLVPIMGFVTAGLTAWYMGRHAWLIFFREPSKRYADLHQPGLRMWLPLAILALMSFWLPFSLNPFEGFHSWWLARWSSGPEQTTHHGLVAGVSLFMALGGLVWLYASRNRLMEAGESSLRQVFRSHFYLDVLYEQYFARAVFQVGRAAQFVDKRIIDGSIHFFAWLAVHEGKTPSLSSLAHRIDDTLIDGLVNGVANGVIRLGRMLRRIHTGSVQQTLWVAMVVLGLVVLGVWLIS